MRKALARATKWADAVMRARIRSVRRPSLVVTGVVSPDLLIDHSEQAVEWHVREPSGRAAYCDRPCSRSMAGKNGWSGNPQNEKC